MTSRDVPRDLPPTEDASSGGNGHSDTTVPSTTLIDPPRIPVGLPHIVQFVEGFLFNESPTVQNVGSKMARYADRAGLLSISLAYLCLITGLGSHHTVTHTIELMASLGLLEKLSAQGGNDRRSNTYRFLGEERDWRSPKAIDIPPGTHLPSALRKSLQDNEALTQENHELRTQLEELQARLALLTNGHSEVTDGAGPSPTGSYESGESGHEDGTIRHSEVTDGEGDPAPETVSHSYGNGPPGDSTENSKAIRHSEVTDGSDGQSYLARRDIVEELVQQHRDHYRRSFRGGIPSAVHHFSASPERMEELRAQVRTLEAENAAQAAGPDPPPEPGGPPVSAGGVDYCPDCDSPFTTHGGAEYCPDCTRRRDRGGG